MIPENPLPPVQYHPSDEPEKPGKAEKKKPDNPILRVLSDIGGFIMLVVILIAAPVIYVAALLGSKMIIGIAMIITGFFNAITFLFWRLVERFITVGIFVGLIAFGVYMYMQENPHALHYAKLRMESAERTAGKLIAIPIRLVAQGYHDIFGDARRQINNLSYDLKLEGNTLLRKFNRAEFPDELKPILDVGLDQSTIGQFAQLLNKTGGLGDRGQNAIPALKSALFQGSPEVQKAAYKSLYNIGGKDAEKILRQYIQQAQRGIK